MKYLYVIITSAYFFCFMSFNLSASNPMPYRHPLKPLYTCFKCKAQIGSLTIINHHYYREHGLRYKCPYCDHGYSSYYSLRKHSIDDHNKDIQSPDEFFRSLIATPDSSLPKGIQLGKKNDMRSYNSYRQSKCNNILISSELASEDTSTRLLVDLDPETDDQNSKVPSISSASYLPPQLAPVPTSAMTLHQILTTLLSNSPLSPDNQIAPHSTSATSSTAQSSVLPSTVTGPIDITTFDPNFLMRRFQENVLAMNIAQNEYQKHFDQNQLIVQVLRQRASSAAHNSTLALNQPPHQPLGAIPIQIPSASELLTMAQLSVLQAQISNIPPR